jgi:hypothetical protein
MNFNDLSSSMQFSRSNKLQWRDISTSNQKLLWEENRDQDDLVNLLNPVKQLNHYTKHQS